MDDRRIRRLRRRALVVSVFVVHFGNRIDSNARRKSGRNYRLNTSGKNSWLYRLEGNYSFGHLFGIRRIDGKGRIVHLDWTNPPMLGVRKQRAGWTPIDEHEATALVYPAQNGARLVVGKLCFRRPYYDKRNHL